MKAIFLWLRAGLWMMVIFIFSSQPDLHSSLPTVLDTVFRKAAHISEFYVLSYFVFYAIQRHRLKADESLFFTFLFTFSYAFLDEYHQLAVRGRNGNSIDVIIDSIGILIFVILFIIIQMRNSHTSKQL